ncbi:conserved hypothetical protein [uncultured delta proteobacterium]|uniref:ChrR-like cupin domain-containing protein n=1 Tax=uncultured delta proteobacterium TaxID=34034 RepID=A0A212JCE4_9DELT|nr:conserved hypothetical protein [uncultured delta proteobacterium]
MKHAGKEHREFFSVDMEHGWTPLPMDGEGFVIEEKVLSNCIDHTRKTGSLTRLLRYSPGAYTAKPVIHDYWEEIFVITGDYTVGSGENAERFEGYTYACRPPHIWHGPFSTDGGSLLYEIQYYDTVVED